MPKSHFSTPSEHHIYLPNGMCANNSNFNHSSMRGVHCDSHYRTIDSKIFNSKSPKNGIKLK